MNSFKHPQLVRAAGGAVVAMLCGLLLWWAPAGEPWVNASYDYLFRFGSHAVTNRVTLILMDNAAFDHFHQTRGQPWDRGLHAQLLDRLAEDGCALVVIDAFFRAPREAATDQQLAAALRRQRHVVLMAEQAEVLHPELTGAQPALPSELFTGAPGTTWGVAWLDPDLDLVVRRHWPFPAPGVYPSLPEKAAQLSGARLDPEPHEHWLRYYGQSGPWTKLSYRFALTQPAGYFRDQVVFIGTQPKTSLVDGEPDEFQTPYTRWTGESMGGTEIMLTSYLNLLNRDWLRRPARWLEAALLVGVGLLLGGLAWLRPSTACAAAGLLAALVALGAVCGSHFTAYWFPWLVIAGGQVPCALAWTLITRRRTAPEKAGRAAKPPKIPGHKLFHPPFGEGAYGKVWLAQNSAGEWRAIKIVFLANFNQNPDPYDREFKGVSRYQRVSDQLPGLLRVDFVSEKKPEYFYYVMELGDAVTPGWEKAPATYKPRDLFNDRDRSPNRRLPVRDCLRLGLALTDTLESLHQSGLTHRDIKPQNVIFVAGHPRLADLGLIAEIRPPEQERTWVGTPGYMPPPPERPGSPQADIYALGMVLYVSVTGRSPTSFPELATALFEDKSLADFMPFNDVLLKACHPDPAQRYATAAEMHRALQQVKTQLDQTPE